LTLPAGLPGFPDARAFRLRRLPGAAGFALLEAEEPYGPRFVVLEVGEPEAVFGSAATAEAAQALGIARADLLLLAIVTLSDGPGGRRAFVNLRAPVAVDRVGRTARQLVLADPRLPLRHPLEPRAAA
ncbi:MAG: flagellar assembly protein FliW, partial [Geminicoccaceae bacterium]|nr:flagellar assembly protein FliW [Geminicoccaceae bacterium]